MKLFPRWASVDFSRPLLRTPFGLWVSVDRGYLGSNGTRRLRRKHGRDAGRPWRFKRGCTCVLCSMHSGCEPARRP